MSRKRNLISLVVMAVLVAAGILALVLIPTFSVRRQSLRIILPDQGQSGVGTVDISRENRAYAQKVELTPSNVRQVLATLLTPDRYIKTARVSYSYADTSTSMTVRSWVSGSMCRTSCTGTSEKEKLLTERSYYCWDRGGREYYSGPRDGIKLEDISLSPDWRELLEDENSTVLSAAFSNVDRNPVITLEWRDGASGGVWSYTVSVDVGLLISATLTEDGKTVYAMQTSVLELVAPPDGTFDLPDGSSAY